MIKDKVKRLVELLEQVREEIPKASKEELLYAASIISDNTGALDEVLTQIEIKLSEIE